MAVGVVTSYFPVDSGILGATSNSWAYSGRTGDKGDGGRRFHHYGEPCVHTSSTSWALSYAHTLCCCGGVGVGLWDCAWPCMLQVWNRRSRRGAA